jgi:hypothetical protein
VAVRGAFPQPVPARKVLEAQRLEAPLGRSELESLHLGTIHTEQFVPTELGVGRNTVTSDRGDTLGLRFDGFHIAPVNVQLLFV